MWYVYIVDGVYKPNRKPSHSLERDQSLYGVVPCDLWSLVFWTVLSYAVCVHRWWGLQTKQWALPLPREWLEFIWCGPMWSKEPNRKPFHSLERDQILYGVVPCDLKSPVFWTVLSRVICVHSWWGLQTKQGALSLSTERSEFIWCCPMLCNEPCILNKCYPRWYVYIVDGVYKPNRVTSYSLERDQSLYGVVPCYVKSPVFWTSAIPCDMCT